MKTRELVNIGIPAGPCADRAKQILQQAHAAKHSIAIVLDDLKRVAASPVKFVDDDRYGSLARQLLDHAAAAAPFQPRESDAPYQIWGSNLEPDAVQQLKNACKLPVAVSGALMPDAHVGYGLPIGGVLATNEAVIPYAVGVDIACRMKMTVLDLPVSALADEKPRLTRAIERETQFGIGAAFRSRRQHDVMDRDWNVTIVTSKLKDRAWAQLDKGEGDVHVGRRSALSARTWRHPAVGRSRRGADGLQGHRRGDGRATRPGRAASPVRAAPREDGAKRRAA